MEYQNIIFEKKRRIAYLTMNRPTKLNALNAALLAELDDAVRHLYRDRDICGVIITGSGNAFVAGADISELRAEAPGKSPYINERWMDTAEGVHGVYSRIENFPYPVIAAVNGYALGGGCELALACDIRIASTKAVMGLPEPKLGMIPCYGGTQRLPRLVGAGIAKELLYTGRDVDAEEALAIGLVNRVVAPEDLIPTAEKLMGMIAQRGPLAVKSAKLAVNRGLTMPLEDALRLEESLGGICIGSDDAKEGINAFLEKRKPVFQNQ